MVRAKQTGKPANVCALLRRVPPINRQPARTAQVTVQAGSDEPLDGDVSGEIRKTASHGLVSTLPCRDTYKYSHGLNRPGRILVEKREKDPQHMADHGHGHYHVGKTRIGTRHSATTASD